MRGDRTVLMKPTYTKLGCKVTTRFDLDRENRPTVEHVTLECPDDSPISARKRDEVLTLLPD